MGPARGDKILGRLGRLALALQPRRRSRLRSALRRAAAALDADWPIERDLAGAGGQHGAVPGARLSAGLPGRRGRPGPVRRPGLRTPPRRDGAGPGRDPRRQPPGAHIAGVHWLYRRGVPLRLLVQRPRHVSRELNRRFDAGGPHPQTELFLRRDLSPAVAVERILRARAALRDGLAIYMNGDIPWSGPEHLPGPAAGPPAPDAGDLDRAGRADPRPGLPRLLHPRAGRPVRARDRAARLAAPRRGGRRRRRLPAAVGERGSPTRRPTPWPTSSGPATSLTPTPPRRPGRPAPAAARPSRRRPDAAADRIYWKIQDSEFKIPDSGFKIPDSGRPNAEPSPIRNPECPIGHVSLRNSRFRTTERRTLPDPESGIRDARSVTSRRHPASDTPGSTADRPFPCGGRGHEDRPIWLILMSIRALVDVSRRPAGASSWPPADCPAPRPARRSRPSAPPTGSRSTPSSAAGGSRPTRPRTSPNRSSLA